MSKQNENSQKATTVVTTGKNVVIDFSDDDGLTIEASDPPCKDSRNPREWLFARPSAFTFRPRDENPTEKDFREQYEEKVRQSFRRGRTLPPLTLQGSRYDIWQGKDAAARNFDTWLFEVGRDRVVYGPAEPETFAMRNAFRVNEAREYFYRKNAKKINERSSLERLTNYSGSFYWHGQKPLAIGVVRSGTDATQQFVGSYCIDIYPNPNSTITFVLSNSTSMKSFLYGGGKEYERGKIGIGGNQIQIYTWTEPIRKLPDFKPPKR